MDKTLTLNKIVSNIASNTAKKSKTSDIYLVTGVNTETFTLNIRHTNNSSESYDDVKVISGGLSNNAGCYFMPKVNDYVIALFLNGSIEPIVIGNVLDTYSISKDNPMQLKEGEFYIGNQTDKSFIYFNEAGELILAGGYDSAGVVQNKIKFEADGTVSITGKLGNKVEIKPNGDTLLKSSNNYGFKVNNSGAVEIRGTSVDFYNTPF